jgi:DNA-directed RNA polymerase specialized sigma24 family protein
MTRRAASLPLPPPELSVYRNHCVSLLRRYFSMSIEVGRLPAILGRELFTTRTETYHAHSFEDTVVFVIDIERCLDRLHPFDKELIALIILQEYTQEEAARIVHLTERQVRNRLCDAIDAVSAMFLEKRMLKMKRRRRRDPDPNPPAGQTFTISCCAEPQVSAGLLDHAQFIPVAAVLS